MGTICAPPRMTELGRAALTRRRYLGCHGKRAPCLPALPSEDACPTGAGPATAAVALASAATPSTSSKERGRGNSWRTRKRRTTTLSWPLRSIEGLRRLNP